MISVLFAAVAATIAQPADERLAASREAGLARWARERAHNYLEDIADERRRGVVELQCRGIADDEEKWMCQKRGAYLAELMSVYKQLRHDDLADMVTEYEGSLRWWVGKYADWWDEVKGWATGEKRTEKGLWVRVVNGDVESWGVFGEAEPWKDAWLMILGRVAEAKKNGALFSHQTFDVVVLFGDGGDMWPHSPFSGGIPRYPVAKYSYAPKMSPYHIPIPWFEWWQLGEHVSATPYRPFEGLKNQAITRNVQGSVARLVLSLATGVNYHPMLNVSMVVSPNMEVYRTRHVKMCRDYMMRDFTRYVKQTGVNLDAVLPQLGTQNCEKLMYNGNFIHWDEYVSYKYLLAPDMWTGAVNRIWTLMYAPGVTMPIQEATNQFQEYYFRDAIPFVHYVPVTNEGDELLANITDTLSWLDRNQDITKAIGEESTRWVRKHKNHKTDMRQWKLYFALLSDAYVPGSRSIPGKVRKQVECTQKPEDFLFHHESGCRVGPKTNCTAWARKIWNFACGPRSKGGDITSEATPFPGAPPRQQIPDRGASLDGSASSAPSLFFFVFAALLFLVLYQMPSLRMRIRTICLSQSLSK